MPNLLITYDLTEPAAHYEDVIETIKSLGNWAHVEKSVWYVKTNYELSAARDAILRQMKSTDKLFVADMINASWFGLGSEVNDFIKNNW